MLSLAITTLTCLLVGQSRFPARCLPVGLWTRHEKHFAFAPSTTLIHTALQNGLIKKMTLEEKAAMIDVASPLRVLWSVIIPQSYPALMAITVFHILWAWNDYFGPLIYLSTAKENWPISVALSTFNGIYGQRPQIIQAGALLTLMAPLLLFVVAQRFFVQGIVITGVEK